MNSLLEKKITKEKLVNCNFVTFVCKIDRRAFFSRSNAIGSIKMAIFCTQNTFSRIHFPTQRRDGRIKQYFCKCYLVEKNHWLEKKEQQLLYHSTMSYVFAMSLIHNKNTCHMSTDVSVHCKPLASRFPCCVLLALSWNTTNENPSTDKLSKAITFRLAHFMPPCLSHKLKRGQWQLVYRIYLPAIDIQVTGMVPSTFHNHMSHLKPYTTKCSGKPKKLIWCQLYT